MDHMVYKNKAGAAEEEQRIPPFLYIKQVLSRDLPQ